MKVFKVITICGLLIFSVTTNAQGTGNYQIDIGRTQGSLTCTIDSASNGNRKCDLKVSNQSRLAISMTEPQGSHGFFGSDTIFGANGLFTLVASADPSKKLTGLILFEGRVNSDESFDGSLSVTPASSLMAIYINPLHVEKVSQQTVRVQMAFVIYAPASVNLQDKETLTNKLMMKVNPLLNLSLK